ncbi:sensor histidine kinase [Marinobacterium jannaschii]|uniref:sensor histidine kinase n=1 Tax=Marinobacterium jannaschii TaxID=64970 RepID=UPI000AD53088|nr:ATP-binding protein [Marinobacterium jannaschii]
MADVARAFNLMVDSLRSSRQKRDDYEAQLKELNRSLEARVEQRTEQLRSRNRALVEANEQIRLTQGQLLQSEKMASIGQLAAGVAHEINNPMGYVMGNLHSLKSYMASYQRLLAEYRRLASCTECDSAEFKALQAEIAALEHSLDIEFIDEDCVVLLEESIEGMERVKSIVQGLRDFAREDSEQFEMADLNNCIESTLKIANSQIQSNSQIETKLKPLPALKCNIGQLGQVLLNLLVNASQAIDKPVGVIRVSSEVRDGLIRISVEDNGRGIKAEHLHKLFDPFFTTKAVGEGTGLGLSISYGIMQEHGGRIQVASQLGQGSCFVLELPLCITDKIPDMKFSAPDPNS